MQDKDFEYFLQNMEKFYEEFGHKFLSIKNQEIIGVYDDFDLALHETLKRAELGTFIIQECLNDKEKLVNHFQGNVMPVLA